MRPLFFFIDLEFLGCSLSVGSTYPLRDNYSGSKEPGNKTEYSAKSWQDISIKLLTAWSPYCGWMG